MTKPELNQREWQYIDDLLANYADGYHTPAMIIDEGVEDVIEKFTLNINLSEGESWLCDNAGTAYEAVAWQLEEAK